MTIRSKLDDNVQQHDPTKTIIQRPSKKEVFKFHKTTIQKGAEFKSKWSEFHSCGTTMEKAHLLLATL